MQVPFDAPCPNCATVVKWLHRIVENNIPEYRILCNCQTKNGSGGMTAGVTRTVGM